MRGLMLCGMERMGEMGRGSSRLPMNWGEELLPNTKSQDSSSTLLSDSCGELSIWDLIAQPQPDLRP